MPELKNGKHEKFVQEVFSGKTATAAYQAVYGEKKSERVACAAAARLLAFVSIAARLKELQAEAAAKHQITVESMIEDFAQDAKDAKADKQHGAAVSARTAIAKLAGLWVDRAENINGNYAISDKPLSEQEWVEKHVKH
jgi:phage terminase small subunit